MLFISNIRTMKIVKIFFLLVLLYSCTPKRNELKNGVWRAELIRPDGKIIRFNFETKDSAGKTILYLQNAGERLLVDSILVKDDSVFIQMPFFDSRFLAKLSAGKMEGVWIKRLAEREQVMPFNAVYNQPDRFITSDKNSITTVAGRWAVDFTSTKNNDTTHSVGEFTQVGSIVSGTFLNPTGDYRYLQGVLDRDTLKLSCFDGGHAFLFTAIVSDSQTISNGLFYSGSTSIEQWTAKRNDQAALADEYAITKLKPGETKLNFSFKSIDGDTVSLSDNRFRNKVVLVQLMGSWCPNCMDETQFLSAYYKQHNKDGIEIIALAYERSADYDRSRQNILPFQKRFDVQYPMLVTGVTVTDSLRTQKTLPQVEKINAFPTLIFIDKKGMVRKIHSGFTGPGTGEHYQHFKDDFDKIVGDLVKEESGR